MNIEKRIALLENDVEELDKEIHQLRTIRAYKQDKIEKLKKQDPRQLKLEIPLK